LLSAQNIVADSDEFLSLMSMALDELATHVTSDVDGTSTGAQATLR